MFGRLFNKEKKELVEVDAKFVFDKAKYHDDSVVEASLGENQSFVHTGMFVAWVVKNDLYSDYILAESRSDIKRIKNEKGTPSELYMNWDGVFIGEMLNKIGYNFALAYFDFEEGKYVEDYCTELAATSLDDADLFRVKDSWENYYKIAKVIDTRFQSWKKCY